MDKRLRCVICGEKASEQGILLEGMPLCDVHIEEAARMDWKSVGYFRREILAEHRRDILGEAGIRSMLLKSDDPSGMILVVAGSQYDRAQKALADHKELFAYCPVCNIEHSAQDASSPDDGQDGEEEPPEDRN